MSAAHLKIQSAFERFATVHLPTKAEPPILSGLTREAVYQWLTELQCEDELKRVGVAPRKSALLSGPPGTGKTTLAHHLAARLGMPLILVNMQQVISKWIGASGENINALFREAKRYSSEVVLFLDEIDAVAAKRVSQESSAAREGNNIVIAILQGIDSYEGIFLGATNRGDMIDPAVWRRFGLQLDVNLPNDDSRFAIIKRYLGPLEMADDDLDIICDATDGATPALLKSLMEGVKRDMVLAGRFQRPNDAKSVFGRIIAATRPGPELPTPPLWSDPDRCLSALDGIAWPPALPEEK